MCDGHGGGGPVASLYAAMLAEGDVEAPVNKRLVGVVVVGQQRLLELALVTEDPLEDKRGRGRGLINVWTDTNCTSHHMHILWAAFSHLETGGILLQKKWVLQNKDIS